MGPLGEPSLPKGNDGAAEHAGGAAAPIENNW